MAIRAEVFSALFLLCGVFFIQPQVDACSCLWAGPFLKVAPNCELVIRGRVSGYYGEDRNIKLAMDVEVIEVLRGKTQESELRIWGDDGMLCRPYVTQFPVGTEWILGLNGPGSKPGCTSNHAISICGQYWLQIKDGKVIGNIDNEKDQSSSQELSIDEFRTRYCGGY